LKSARCLVPFFWRSPLLLLHLYGLPRNPGKKAEFFHPNAAARQVGIERD